MAVSSAHFVSLIFSVSFFIIYFLLPVITLLILACELLMMLYTLYSVKQLQWSRGSMLAFGTQVHGFAPGRSRRIFRAKKSSARLSSEGK